VRVPGDKSISHRAILHKAIGTGTARIEGLGPGDDVLSSIACVRALGVRVTEIDASGYLVEGLGAQLAEPGDVIDAGNSGTTTRLLSGILSAQPFLTVITGDDSLRARPMDRVMEPLRSMGASALGRGGDRFLPMAIRGGDLRAIDYVMPIASAQVKSCILLAAALAKGTSTIVEPVPTRDHTERLLRAQGADLRVDATHITIRGGMPLRCVDSMVPGDTSAAAFWVIAACIHPDAEIVVRGVGLTHGRTGFIDVLQSMDGSVEVVNPREVGGEPVGDIVARSSRLRGTTIGGDLIPRIIDEAPVLSVAAIFAEGPTRIVDAHELRYKESDRIAAVAGELGKLGARMEELPDGVVIQGTGRLAGGSADSRQDHRMAMSLAVAGLASEQGVTVQRPQCVSISYPGFWDDLSRLCQ
jgi:3-phosphoshikimate 1-carboxyvinyltransferase